MNYQATQTKFLLCVILFFGMSAGISAADGDLDTTFGNGGLVMTDNGSDSETILDLVVQPDGKIIAVGFSFIENSPSQYVVLRFNPNGSIDSTFGTNGKVIIESGRVFHLALQSDGKIVLAGDNGDFSNKDLYVGRLNSDGSVDTTFNGTGSVILDFRGTDDLTSSVEIQPDGKIVVLRTIFEWIDSDNDFTLVRFNSDGSLDTTFDGDGKVVTTITSEARLVRAYDLVVQPDGKIVAVGTAALIDPVFISEFQYFVTVRYNPDGTLDSTFDGDGKVATRLGSRSANAVANSVVLQCDGKIVVAGTVRDSSHPLGEASLARYNPDGSLDSSYGIGGQTMVPERALVDSGVTEAAIQANNKVVIVGFVGNVKEGRKTAIGRFNANGSFDTSFSGSFLNTIGNSLRISSGSVAIQPDRRVLFGGTRDGDFLIAGFEASNGSGFCSASNGETFADFDGDGRTDASVFRNGTWFIQPSSTNNPNTYYEVQFGTSTDKLVPADYDGDGKTDIAVWRENVSGNQSYFYILQSSTNTLRTYQFGNTGDDPRVVGDWDGDGRADLAVYRQAVNAGEQSLYYYIPSSATNPFYVVIPWGTVGDKAIRGDFDGDGKSDAAVFRPSNGVWYVLNSSDNQPSYTQWGIATDKLVSGDFDGDGKTDFTVYRDGVWYVLQSSNNQARYQYWGISSDKLVAGDYDGDGLTDFAVWRNGVYYILQNANSQAIYQQFGIMGDIPVASIFVQ